MVNDSSNIFLHLTLQKVFGLQVLIFKRRTQPSSSNKKNKDLKQLCQQFQYELIDTQLVRIGEGFSCSVLIVTSATRSGKGVML